MALEVRVATLFIPSLTFKKLSDVSRSFGVLLLPFFGVFFTLFLAGNFFRNHFLNCLVMINVYFCTASAHARYIFGTAKKFGSNRSTRYKLTCTRERRAVSLFDLCDDACKRHLATFVINVASRIRTIVKVVMMLITVARDQNYLYLHCDASKELC